MTKEELAAGLLAELGNFEALLRSLSDEEWSTPSRCAGWTVGDVAGHVIGTMADITAGRFDGLGTPEVTQREVDERRGLSPKELADECAEVQAATAALLPAFDQAAWDGPAPGGYDGSLAQAVEALWYDAYLHGDDIRAAIGRPSEHGPGLAAATSHVEFELNKREWTGAVPTEDDASLTFVLVATGRAPAEAHPKPLVNIYAD